MKPAFETICVIGLGYVGLPTAAVLANRGVQVLGVDIREDTVRVINQGRTHIVEPDLDILVHAAVTTGRLRADTRPAPADAFIIAVPTPFAEDHRPDLSFVEAATDALVPILKAGDLVIIESTVPVGTSEIVSRRLSRARPDLRFPLVAGQTAEEGEEIHVAHSPERVLPGRVLLEIVRNDRVMGGVSRCCGERAAELYRLFVTGECLITDARTAEMVKLTENAFRDVNIAFANELSLVCSRLGVKVWDVIELANRHPRVDILKPGPGVGGHCIAVDPWFLVNAAPAETPLIQAARRVNDGKPGHVVSLVRAAAAGFDRPRIACLGLSYKADIDDLRESPAVSVVESLVQANPGSLLVVEPYVRELPVSLQGRPNVVLTGLDRALSEADVVVVLVDHRPFREVPPERLAGRLLIDTRGIWRRLFLSWIVPIRCWGWKSCLGSPRESGIVTIPRKKQGYSDPCPRFSGRPS